MQTSTNLNKPQQTSTPAMQLIQYHAGRSNTAQRSSSHISLPKDHRLSHLRLVNLRLVHLRLVHLRLVHLRLVHLRLVNLRLVHLRLLHLRLVHIRLVHLRLVHLRLVHLLLVHLRLVHLRLVHLRPILRCAKRKFAPGFHTKLLYVTRKCQGLHLT